MDQGVGYTDRPLVIQRTAAQARARAACLRCRRLKKRCDTQRPQCRLCVLANTPCEYETVNSAETRLAALKRKHAYLQSDMEELSSGLVHLQSLEEPEVVDFLHRLKGAPDPLAVLRSLRSAAQTNRQSPRHVPLNRGTWSPVSPNLTMVDLNLALEHPSAFPAAVETDACFSQLPGFSDEWLPFVATGLADFAVGADVPTAAASSPDEHMPSWPSFVGPRDYTLCDPRLADLDIGYWLPTNLPSSLAATAISLYLEVDQPLYGFFEPNLFIGDLVRRRLDFCSSLLVCAILAAACHTYGCRTHQLAELEDEFYLSAERLADLDRDIDDVSTLASLMIMSSVAHATGRDLRGQQYLTDGVQMAQRMGLLGEGRLAPHAFNFTSFEALRAHAFASWGVFNYATLHAWYWRGINTASWIVRPPSLPVLGVGMVRADIYPTDGSAAPTLPVYMGESFVSLCSFWPIVHGVISLYFDSTTPLLERVPLAVAEKKCLQLLRWANQLPQSMARTNKMPHHVAMAHVYLHAVLMDLFRPFLSRNTQLHCFAHEQIYPRDIFACSSQQLRNISVFYHNTFQASPASHTLIWLTAVLWGSNAVLQHKQGPNRSKDLIFYLESSSGMLASHPTIESAIQGVAAMAISAGVLSLDQAQGVWKRLQSVQARAKNAAQRTPGYVVDLDTAMVDPSAARSDGLARRFVQLSTTE